MSNLMSGVHNKSSHSDVKTAVSAGAGGVMHKDANNMSCIFCEMVGGNSPCHKIWEDENHMAFLSIFPNTEGFTVVIPKKHFSSYLFSQDNDVIGALVVAAKKVALLLDTALDDVARTGMIFEGYGVDHLHAKLFPMHGTGNDPEFKPIASNVDKYFERYEGYISSHDFRRANEAELARLAAKIRAAENT